VCVCVCGGGGNAYSYAYFLYRSAITETQKHKLHRIVLLTQVISHVNNPDQCHISYML
jgi:hypothetical protein